MYRDVYTVFRLQFIDYLNSLPGHELHKIEHKLQINIFTFLDIKNDLNVEEIFHVFDRFYFKFGGFPDQNKLITVPNTDLRSFIKTEILISPVELYKKFISKEVRRFVCIQFLAVLNVYSDGDSEISKDGMSEFFLNLSM